MQKNNDNSIRRHFIKTLSWRIIGSLDTFFLGWYFTGEASLGAGIASAEFFTKTVLYFLHERAYYKYFKTNK
jgi:uncharacterized membrane protein